MIPIITLLALPLLVSSPTPAKPPRAATDSSDMTMVVVQNDRSAPVTVYAEGAVGYVKIGVVPPDSIVSFRIPDLMVGAGATIDFFVHPRGGFDEDSGALELRRGDKIGLLVPPR